MCLQGRPRQPSWACWAKGLLGVPSARRRELYLCLPDHGLAGGGGALSGMWLPCVLCQGAGDTARVLMDAGKQAGLEGVGLWPLLTRSFCFMASRKLFAALA